ncbi:alpha/beta fold hydrolase [Chitinophaga silvisoli]|uniref:Alpha/beta hydrolase n=1 Tax=Chitinophaga silvisoli TaxID=2291814 RepID=A0A3E1NSJ3_9BACT|nr:alpha/beta hydrolase [Chitinophaga silvisoli]RFM30814.1 alpha/beta hydrolase [Chitinophaga silvisoli]
MHKTITIDKLQISYRSAGSNNKDVILLLHGWPQTSYSWRFVMPILAAAGFHVIAPDLPGMGDSGIPASFDKKHIAAIIHNMMLQLNYDNIFLAGHDWGASVAYSYAAQFPNAVQQLALLDVPPVGEYLEKLPLLPRNNKALWWFAFHQVQDLPELLIAGKEKEYLSYFYKNSAFKKEVFDDATISEYCRTYSRQEKLSASLNYYRAVLQDIDDNKTILPMPVLTIGGEQGLGHLAYNITKALAPDITNAIIPDCGHYIQEEQPDLLCNELIRFFKQSTYTPHP